MRKLVCWKNGTDAENRAEVFAECCAVLRAVVRAEPYAEHRAVCCADVFAVSSCRNVLQSGKCVDTDARADLFAEYRAEVLVMLG